VSITLRSSVSVIELAVHVTFNEKDPHGHYACGCAPLKSAYYPLIGTPKHNFTDQVNGKPVVARDFYRACWNYKPEEVVAIWKKIIPDRDIRDLSIVRSSDGTHLHTLGFGFGSVK
jgi:hypothetical protein